MLRTIMLLLLCLKTGCNYLLHKFCISVPATIKVRAIIMPVPTVFPDVVVWALSLLVYGADIPEWLHRETVAKKLQNACLLTHWVWQIDYNSIII